MQSSFIKLISPNLSIFPLSCCLFGMIFCQIEITNSGAKCLTPLPGYRHFHGVAEKFLLFRLCAEKHIISWKALNQFQLLNHKHPHLDVDNGIYGHEFLYLPGHRGIRLVNRYPNLSELCNYLIWRSLIIRAISVKQGS